MEFNIVVGSLADAAVAVAIMPVFLDEPLPSEIAGLVEADEFPALMSKTLLVQLPPTKTLAARRVMLTGLGLRARFTPERLRRSIAYGVLAARSNNQKTVAAVVPTVNDHAPHSLVRAVADALLLANYSFERFRGTGWNPLETDYYPLQSATIVVSDDGQATVARDAETIARGVLLARDLGNEPPATCTPTRFAELAAEIAQRGGMGLTVYGREEMREHGMGCFLGVAQGATEEPKFIALEYGTKGDGPTIALVGKGVTFDSGGISIKPADGMDLMKMDMMGAAAVLGTMSVLADLRPAHLHVVGIVGATENLLGGAAFKPGDILRAMNGITVEILNTDAEGRLVLGDCLAYAVATHQPDAIIDLATLTGACVVGLGHHIGGLMTNNAAFADRVKQASADTAELVWELPMLPEYREAVKSTIADIRNTGSSGRAGGAITAATFLERFVADRPWVHLDIAGVAWAEEMPKPYAKQGATGFGVRLLVELLHGYTKAA